MKKKQKKLKKKSPLNIAEQYSRLGNASAQNPDPERYPRLSRMRGG